MFLLVNINIEIDNVLLYAVSMCLKFCYNIFSFIVGYLIQLYKVVSCSFISTVTMYTLYISERGLSAPHHATIVCDFECIPSSYPGLVYTCYMLYCIQLSLPFLHLPLLSAQYSAS